MENVRIQDDLYHAVNGKHLEELVIPDDRPTAGGFSDLDQGVEKTLMGDFADFASGAKEIPFDEMKQAIALYNKVLDSASRNAAGIKPLLPYLARLQAVRNVDELNAAAKEMALRNNVDLPFQFAVEPNMKDATVNAFIILGPHMILPDTTYYADDNPTGKALLGVYSQMASQLLAFTPLTEEEQKQYLADTLAFDGKVAKVSKSQLEWANYVDNYHPLSLDEAVDYMKPFDFKGFLGQLYGDQLPAEVIAYDPKSIKGFTTYFNAENFEEYQHWAYVNMLLKGSNFLSEEMHTLSTTYRRALFGIAKDPVLEKQAYQLASRVFMEPVGVYYGRTYFGEEAKADVVDMCHQIIDEYKSRMKVNTFLAEETKEKAITKLNTIEVKMGYPDVIDPFYGTLKVEEDDSLLNTMVQIGKQHQLHNLEKLHKPVDRSEWGMPGHMVNASYNPFANDITFPAAILQPPFYSVKQTRSENLGGIGAVIGHEVSHAFDNNGAAFDENGNLNNWWKEEDFAEFRKLTQDMIEEFDGMDFYGGKVNGELIVSENIADNGGMSVALSIMEKMDDADYQDFFKNWARVWCQKASMEYIMLRLSNDVHAPAELRANIQPRNFDEWYQAFDVKATDKMYIAPEKRIRIW